MICWGRACILCNRILHCCNSNSAVAYLYSGPEDKQLYWIWIILSSRSLDVQHAYNQNSLPELKAAVYVWEARWDPKGRERKGRAELLVYLSSGLCLSPQKIRREKRSDAKWHSRKPQVTEIPVVHPCTCSLEANTQRKQAGEVSLTHCQLTASMIQKHRQRPGPPWKSHFRKAVHQISKGKWIQ